MGGGLSRGGLSRGGLSRGGLSRGGLSRGAACPEEEEERKTKQKGEVRKKG
jgi:hypothetical protein